MSSAHPTPLHCPADRLSAGRMGLRGAALAVCLAAGGAPCHAQSIRELFLKMPQETCPALTEYNRLELVDNQRNGKDMRTRNALNRYSTMESLTDNHFELSVSPSARLAAKLLPLADGGSVIMLISSVVADSMTSSIVDFRNTDWEPLPSEQHLVLPPGTGFQSVECGAETDTLTVTRTLPKKLHAPAGHSDQKRERTYYVWNTQKGMFEEITHQ